MLYLPFARSNNFRGFAVLFVTIFLASCGGGGGGGSGSSNNTDGNQSTEQFPSVPAPTLSDISTTALASIDRRSSRLLADAALTLASLNDSLFEATYFENYFARPDLVRGDQIETLSYNCSSGSVTETYRTADTVNGHAILHYLQCVDGDYIKDGYQVIDASFNQNDSGTTQRYSMLFSHYTLTPVDTNKPLTINGELTATLGSQNLGLATITFNFEIVDLTSGEHVQAKNLVTMRNVGGLSISRSGTIYASTAGIATLTAASTFANASEHSTLTGLNNLSVGVTGTDSTDLFLQLDTDGDGVIDAFANNVPRDHLVQSNTTNSPPNVPGISDTYNVPYPADINLFNYIYNVSDPDDDFLAYKWSVVSAPQGATYDLKSSIDVNPAFWTTATPEASFSTSYPGDYVIRLTITDNSGPITKDIHIHVQYGAPVLSAPTTLNVNSLGTASIQITRATTIDGPYTYEVVSGPTGLTINNQGLLSFSARSNPLFSETFYDSVVRVNNIDNLTEINIPIRVYDPSKNDPMVRTNPRFNSGIIGAGDFNGSNSKQILLADFSTLKWNGTNYIQNWVQPFAYNSDLGTPQVVVGNIDSDQQTEIVEVANSDRQLLVTVFKNGKEIKSRRIVLEGTYPFATNSTAHAAIADIDNDGSNEIVVLADESYLSNNDQQKLFVLNAATLDTKWTVNNLSTGITAIDANKGFVVANIDNNSALEVVTANGFVVDGITHQIEIRDQAFAGNFQCAADFDGSGTKKIVSRDTKNGFIHVYDAIQRQEIKTFRDSSLMFSLITCADTDNNGKDEILASALVNGTNHNSLSLYDLSSDHPIRQVNTPSMFYATGSLFAYDLNGDGYPEIIENAYATTTNYLSVNSVADGTTIWDSSNIPNLSGFNGAYDYQPNASTHRALYWTSAPTTVATIDLSLGTVSTKNLVSTFNTSANYADVQAADYDADGRSDLFLLSADPFSPYGYRAKLDVVDAETNTIKRSYTSPWLTSNPHLFLADVTGDSIIDAIFGESLLSIYNVVAGASVTDTLAASQHIVFGDLDGDGNNELVNVVNNQLTIYKMVNGSYQIVSSSTFINPNYPLSDPVIINVDNNGAPEILLALGGILHVFDNQGQLIRSNIISGSIVGIVEDRFSPGNLLLTVQNQASNLMETSSTASISYILSINPFTGNINWRSGALRGSPLSKSMHYGPDVSPNHPRLFLGTSAAMYIIQ